MSSAKLIKNFKLDQSQSKKSNFSFLFSSMERQKERENKQNHQDNNPKSNYVKPTTISIQPHIKPFLEGKDSKETEVHSQMETLVNKIKKYLSATDDMVHSPHKVTPKIKKQAISLSTQLIQLISSYEENQQKMVKSSIFDSIQVHSTFSLAERSFSMNSSKVSIQPQYLKKINDLQSQKGHLQSLISKHQRANIKMFIQLNQGESEEIEAYKKQLASLFEKYKQLQKIVREQKTQTISLKIQLANKNSQIQKLSQIVQEKQSKKEDLCNERIYQMQAMINDQNQELTSAISKIKDLLNQEHQYKERQRQLKTIISKMEKEKDNKKINQIIHQAYHGKDDELYRVIMLQASTIDDILSQ